MGSEPDTISGESAGSPKNDSEKPLDPKRSLTVIPDSKDGNGSGSLFSWLFEMFSRKRNGTTIREDLADALSGDVASSEAEGFSAEEKHMIGSILRLRDVRVEDVMVPRTDIVAVNEEITLAELLRQFEESGHSRMPVYGETMDDPKGMIHIRDVVAHITKRSAMSKAELARRKTSPAGNLDLKKVSLSKPIRDLKLLREVVYVPPSMGVRELMARMQADRIQMALVIDEYGGTDGLISLEDIVEEIVGEIEDEHDDDEDLIIEKEPGRFICDAKAELDDIRSYLGDDFYFGEHEEDVDTIGGLVFDITGRIPVRGEIITQNGFEFRILDADPRRIRRIELLRSTRRRSRKPVTQTDDPS